MENLFAGSIFLFGTCGLLLVAFKNKWGFVVGLIGQLFFTEAAYADKQRDLFVYSIILTIIWLYGIYTWFHTNKN